MRHNIGHSNGYALYVCKSKGQEISEDFFLVFNSSKNQRNFLLISALASKKWLNQKNIKQFIMLNRPY